MSAQKPVYSRPSDEEPTTAPKKRSRRRKRKNATTKTNSITNRYPLHENDALAKRDPTTAAKGVTKRDPLQGDAVVEPTTERNAALANYAPRTNCCTGVSPRSTTHSTSTSKETSAMPQKPLIPDPDGRQIAYSRVAAVMLAIRLLNDAADALLTGHPMKKPKLPRASPTDDAVTARSLQVITKALADYARTNTSNE